MACAGGETATTGGGCAKLDTESASVSLVADLSPLQSAASAARAARNSLRQLIAALAASASCNPPQEADESLDGDSLPPFVDGASSSNAVATASFADALRAKASRDFEELESRTAKASTACGLSLSLALPTDTTASASLEAARAPGAPPRRPRCRHPAVKRPRKCFAEAARCAVAEPTAVRHSNMLAAGCLDAEDSEDDGSDEEDFVPRLRLCIGGDGTRAEGDAVARRNQVLAVALWDPPPLQSKRLATASAEVEKAVDREACLAIVLSSGHIEVWQRDPFCWHHAATCDRASPALRETDSASAAFSVDGSLVWVTTAKGTSGAVPTEAPPTTSAAAMTPEVQLLLFGRRRFGLNGGRSARTGRGGHASRGGVASLDLLAATACSAPGASYRPVGIAAMPGGCLHNSGGRGCQRREPPGVALAVTAQEGSLERNRGDPVVAAGLAAAPSSLVHIFVWTRGGLAETATFPVTPIQTRAGGRPAWTAASPSSNSNLDRLDGFWPLASAEPLSEANVAEAPSMLPSPLPAAAATPNAVVAARWRIALWIRLGSFGGGCGSELHLRSGNGECLAWMAIGPECLALTVPPQSSAPADVLARLGLVGVDQIEQHQQQAMQTRQQQHQQPLLPFLVVALSSQGEWLVAAAAAAEASPPTGSVPRPMSLQLRRLGGSSSSGAPPPPSRACGFVTIPTSSEGFLGCWQSTVGGNAGANNGHENGVSCRRGYVLDWQQLRAHVLPDGWRPCAVGLNVIIVHARGGVASSAIATAAGDISVSGATVETDPVRSLASGLVMAGTASATQQAEELIFLEPP
eukprot:TRINITY_DN49046_c0_g1_i1.p1 TRINITY_DN49046_c0_g1~~TRINITY_DN49046_c0_g1_i1.p1  ORF type:complete len:809 (+),score=150.18 TRINITY_DN49046_c0_g1_i1:159-2585(+)